MAIVHNKRKLKNYLINTVVQGKIIFYNLLHSFIIVALTIMVLLSGAGPEMKIILIIVSVVLLVVINQILISHLICGPLVNFTITFKKIADGDLTRKIYLRRDDLLKDEAQQINNMIDGLSSLIADIMKDSRLLASVLKEIKLKAGNNEDFKKIFSALENNEPDIEERLTRIRLVHDDSLSEEKEYKTDV